MLVCVNSALWKLGLVFRGNGRFPFDQRVRDISWLLALILEVRDIWSALTCPGREVAWDFSLHVLVFELEKLGWVVGISCLGLGIMSPSPFSEWLGSVSANLMLVNVDLLCNRPQFAHFLLCFSHSFGAQIFTTVPLSCCFELKEGLHRIWKFWCSGASLDPPGWTRLEVDCPSSTPSLVEPDRSNPPSPSPPPTFPPPLHSHLFPPLKLGPTTNVWV